MVAEKAAATLLSAGAAVGHGGRALAHRNILSELTLMDWISVVTGVIGLTATFIFGAWAMYVSCPDSPAYLVKGMRCRNRYTMSKDTRATPLTRF